MQLMPTRLPLHIRGCRFCTVILALYLLQLFLFVTWRRAANSVQENDKNNHRLFTLVDNDDGNKNFETLPTIYIITPTYARHVQKAELTRLSHTLMLVPKVHWIIVEDSDWSTRLVSEFVNRLRSRYNFHRLTHLRAKTPPEHKRKPNEPSWTHPKGIWQRNRALEWLKQNSLELDWDGVIYFADDDNTYDLELFSEMRHTNKVSVWPVGFAGGLLVERPIVRSGAGAGAAKKISSFNSMWESQRPFPLDMAGFAVSLRLYMSQTNVSFSAEQKIGYAESHFLGQLINSWNELEPKADDCSRVLVWHTQTKAPRLHEERKLDEPSDSDIEL